MRSLTAGILFVSLTLAAGRLPADTEVDFGDHSSQTLTAKAWEMMNAGDLDRALLYANKCIAMYEVQAREMQLSLAAFPSNTPKEETTRYWALNDVGTCWFIRGEILMKQGRTADARKAYETCHRDFGYAQCWDNRGWFWKPGEAAMQKALELEFDAE